MVHALALLGNRCSESKLLQKIGPNLGFPAVTHLAQHFKIARNPNARVLGLLVLFSLRHFGH